MSPNSRTIDETVLITGGGQRIGQSIAIDLATHGWRVLIHCNRSKSEADETARIIKEQGGKASVLCADLLVESELSKLLKAMVEDKSPITCLVNNASIFEEDSAMTRTRKTWDKHMEMNLRVPFISVCFLVFFSLPLIFL